MLLFQSAGAAHDDSCLMMVAAPFAGITAPHPNAGCVLVSQDGRTISEAFQLAQVQQQMPE